MSVCFSAIKSAGKVIEMHSHTQPGGLESITTRTHARIQSGTHTRNYVGFGMTAGTRNAKQEVQLAGMRDNPLRSEIESKTYLI